MLKENIFLEDICLVAAMKVAMYTNHLCSVCVDFICTWVTGPTVVSQLRKPEFDILKDMTY